MVKMAQTETIGGRISRLRRDKDIPQYRLASDIGMHPSSLNQIEKGRRNPKAETVAKLAKALDVTRDYLWDGDQPVAPPASPGRANHADHVQAIEVSALIRQTIHTEIRAAVVDILNAVSVAVSTTGRPQATEQEDQRPQAKAGRTSRH